MKNTESENTSLSLLKKITRSDENKMRIRHVINTASYSLPKVPLSIYRKIQTKFKHIDREKILDLEQITAGDLRIRVTREELEEALGGEYRTNNVKRACDTILSTPMYFKVGETEDYVKEEQVFSNLVGLIKIDKQGLIAEFTPTQLQIYCHGYFTEYREELTYSFKTTYTFRIFDLLMKYQNTGRINNNSWRVWTVTIPFADLHWSLRAPDSYRKRFANFKANVLDPATEEINALDEFDVEWDVERVKRKVHKIIFRVKQKIIGPVKPIEVPENDKTIQWLDEYFSPTKKQKKLAWEWYIAGGKTEKLHRIYKYCKNREARTDKEPIKLISYFWSMVDNFKDKKFDS